MDTNGWINKESSRVVHRKTFSLEARKNSLSANTEQFLLRVVEENPKFPRRECPENGFDYTITDSGCMESCAWQCVPHSGHFRIRRTGCRAGLEEEWQRLGVDTAVGLPHFLNLRCGRSRIHSSWCVFRPVSNGIIYFAPFSSRHSIRLKETMRIWEKNQWQFLRCKVDRVNDTSSGSILSSSGVGNRHRGGDCLSNPLAVPLIHTSDPLGGREGGRVQNSPCLFSLCWFLFGDQRRKHGEISRMFWTWWKNQKRKQAEIKFAFMMRDCDFCRSSKNVYQKIQIGTNKITFYHWNAFINMPTIFVCNEILIHIILHHSVTLIVLTLAVICARRIQTLTRSSIPCISMSLKQHRQLL